MKIFIPKQKYPFQLISALNDIESVHRHNGENQKKGVNSTGETKNSPPAPPSQ